MTTSDTEWNDRAAWQEQGWRQGTSGSGISEPADTTAGAGPPDSGVSPETTVTPDQVTTEAFAHDPHDRPLPVQTDGGPPS